MVTIIPKVCTNLFNPPRWRRLDSTKSRLRLSKFTRQEVNHPSGRRVPSEWDFWHRMDDYSESNIQFTKAVHNSGYKHAFN